MTSYIMILDRNRYGSNSVETTKFKKINGLVVKDSQFGIVFTADLQAVMCYGFLWITGVV